MECYFRRNTVRGYAFSILVIAILLCAASEAKEYDKKEAANPWKMKPKSVESRHGVVAADDGRCSAVGVSILTKGGHAVDAAVATALCLGVVSPTSSGIGGGGFMVVRDSESQETTAFNMREKAPSASSRDMYANNPKTKSTGPMSLGVPGELAGLRSAWEMHGRIPWKDLFESAIKFAKEGFKISPFTGYYLEDSRKSIMDDPGLRQVFTRDRKELLKAGDLCFNVELGNTLEAIAEHGPETLYGGPIGEKLIEEIRKAGGILTMSDLENYAAEVSEAISTRAFGYEILTVPPPSSGGLSVGLVLNVLDGYESKDDDEVGLHRLAEAMKHAFSKRMNLGDPAFEDIDGTVSDMLSIFFSAEIRQRIDDNATFDAQHYKAGWSQFVDHGTSHVVAVDSDRNAVSMTTTLNHRFGGGMRSVSTGIILNNQMDDFSTPTDETLDDLPPAETNFIEPNKRPLSSIAPIIVLKDNQFAGAIGCGGGSNIIPAVAQIFIYHFVMGMEPLQAVQSPRIYHSVDPRAVLYENWTVYDTRRFELSEEKRHSLVRRGHVLEAVDGGAICQLAVHNLTGSAGLDRAFRGILTAVSDPRKSGWPEAVWVGKNNDPPGLSLAINLAFLLSVFMGTWTLAVVVLSMIYE